MRVWFFRLDTGHFTGRSFSGPEDALNINTPDACGYAANVTDWQAQRADLGVAEQIAIIRGRHSVAAADEQAALDSEIQDLHRRLVIDDPELATQHRARRQAAERSGAIKREIAALESKQARIDRDLRLRPSEIGADGKTPGQRLIELDQRVAALRAQLLPPEPT